MKIPNPDCSVSTSGDEVPLPIHRTSLLRVRKTKCSHIASFRPHTPPVLFHHRRRLPHASLASVFFPFPVTAHGMAAATLSIEAWWRTVVAAPPSTSDASILGVGVNRPVPSMAYLPSTRSHRL
ncbi:Os03g0310701 [Oryza sativa Japonica Group]|uniref:Os03g0310701 protein n=2 Tax=Oryza sativa subsp. japonica TaxID=39947 RepID=C7J0P9_ORYSJ|nr:Os03g0310701 [Oryza sativa Japonica Group]|eukprot:NP_001173393.1 Os03g0310701 [Oryza sativa Japonica Group]